jgi:hypothetical protein
MDGNQTECRIDFGQIFNLFWTIVFWRSSNAAESLTGIHSRAFRQSPNSLALHP